MKISFVNRTAVVGAAAALVAVLSVAASAGAGNGVGQLPPQLVSPPSVTGAATVGSTLSAATGSWKGGSISYGLVWQRCDSSGASCVSTGTTEASYKVVAADVGATLRVLVSATNRNGSVSAPSATTGVVSGAASPPLPSVLPPASTSAPQISGSLQVGATLGASSGSWSGSPTEYAYQWSRCSSAGASCAAIDGATSGSYALASVDAGSTLRVTVTATNAGGSTAATSVATGVVTAVVTQATPTSTVPPQVAGTPQVGLSVTGSTGSWSGSPTSYDYAWSSCDSSGSNCATIPGATSSSYLVASDETGHTLRVSVAASNAAGTTIAVSAASAVATAPPAPATPAVSRFGVAIGGNVSYYSSSNLQHLLDLLQAAHVGWIRFDVNWSVVQNGGPASYNWAPFDNVVKSASARGMQLLATIQYTPAWARPAGAPAATPPVNLSDYAAFARTAVQHFAPLGVHTYEIWNEPNIVGFWSTGPNAAQYTQMLKLAYPAIKGADPGATVISAGLSPYGSYGATDSGHINPVTFLERMYAAGAKGSMDAVGWHPYSYPYGLQPATWSAWSQMSATSPSARSVMSANGDDAKQIWATEFGEPTGTSSRAVSESAQAQYVTDSYAALGKLNWAGPGFFYCGYDAGTDLTNVEDNFGIVHNDWTLKPSYAAFKTAAAG